jgi:hypothetical protein
VIDECRVFGSDVVEFIPVQIINVLFNSTFSTLDVVRQELCVSTMGFLIALIITALLALAAVAVAVSYNSSFLF